MTEWTNRTLIVPAAQVEFARLLTATIAGPSGAGMWTAPLSPTGELPATHYINEGLIDQQFAALLPLTEYLPEGGFVHDRGQPEACAHLATEAGLAVTGVTVMALFEVSSVTAEDAQTAMARMGLMIASQPESQE